VKSLKQVTDRRTLCALTLSLIAAWLAGCSLFQSQKPAPPPSQISPAPTPAPVETPLPRASRRVRIRAASVPSRKALQPRPGPLQPPAPPPVVTLENSDAKADVQHLIEQVTLKLEHTNRAELPESVTPTYQQAKDLITAAQHAMADQDYAAASSLAEKASALTSQLPSGK
jgi:hypothetical protein